jgi:microcystin-dependent protein
LVPIGSVIPFAGGSAPTGFLICDGSTHDVIGTCATCGLFHSDLAALLSTTYGGTIGSTFKLPDLQGRLPVGKGTHADVNALNNNEGVTTVSSRTPNHTHSVPAHKHVITAIALGDDSPDHNHTNSLGYYVEGTQHNGPGFEDHSSSLIGGVDWTSGGANQRHSHGLHSSYINNVDYNRAGNSGATSGDSSFSTSAQSSAQRVPYIVLNYIIKAI